MSKKRKGRGIDHYWQMVKYKGDCTIYAKCRCGYNYECSTINTTNGFHVDINIGGLYPYCPNCGARKTRYYPNIIRIDKYRWE